MVRDDGPATPPADGADPMAATAATGPASDPLAATAALASDPLSTTIPPRDRAPDVAERAAVALVPEVSPSSYEILGEQGRGGLGRVLRARDRRTGRVVAIKEILRGSPQALARFRREALVTANLQHPAIVPVYEVGHWPDGQPFYAMKLVDGVPLAAAIARATTATERLALLPHVIHVAEALAYAHAAGWIHRDLKPGNVLVGAFGETVVIDWGLAKQVDRADDAPLVSSVDDAAAQDGAATVDGQVLGTPVYMAPEQARGEAVDARADVYAIGALLYHVLAGVIPYAGARSGAEVIAQVIAGPPRPLRELAPELPLELGTIVARAMAHRADQRYPSARELADDLARFRAGNLVAAHAYTAWQLVRRWVRRHRAPVAVAVVAVIVLAVVGVVTFRQNVVARRSAEAAERRATAAQQVAEERRREAEARVAALHTELGLRELTAGAPARALPYLADAYAKTPDDPIVGFLVGRALEALAQLEVTAQAGPVAGFAMAGSLVLPRSPTPAPVIDAATRAVAPMAPGGVGALAPDGSWLVVTQDDGTTLAIDRATRAVRARRQTPDDEALPVWAAIDERGQVLLVGADGGVRRSGPDLVPRERAAAGFAAYAVVSSGASRVIVAGAHGELWRWDLDAGRGGRLPSPHAGAIAALCASRDGRVWISIDDRSTAVWRDDRVVARVPHAGTPGGCAIDAAGRVAATAIDTVGITRWDLDVDPPRPRAALLRDAALVGASDRVAVAADGATIAIGDGRGGLELIDAASGVGAGRVPAHEAPIAALAFTPDGRHVVTGTLGGDVRVWQNRPVARVTAVAPSGAGRFLAADRVVTVGGDAGQIVALPGGAREALRGDLAAVTSVEVSPDRSQFATGGADGLTQRWRADGTPLGALGAAGARTLRPRFDARGARLISIAVDGRVTLWQTSDGQRVGQVQAPGPIFGAELSPDGDLVVTHAAGDRRATLWDGARGIQIADVSAPVGQQSLAARWSPDGDVLAVTAAGMVVAVFDGRTGAPRFEINHDAPVYAITWAADGQRLASGDAVGAIYLTDRRGRRLRALRVDGDVIALQFAPGGRLLAVATGDGFVRILELAGGRELARHRRAAYATDLAFAPDGARLVLAGPDGPVEVWEVASYRGPVDELARRLRCLVPYQLEAGGLAAAPTDPAACE